jgi:hypothetical protein
MEIANLRTQMITWNKNNTKTPTSITSIKICTLLVVMISKVVFYEKKSISWYKYCGILCYLRIFFEGVVSTIVIARSILFF